jgi:hypothetical protein
MENPTFTERIATLKEIATQLRTFAETILVEAQRMEGVRARFKERVSKRSGSPRPQRR